MTNSSPSALAVVRNSVAAEPASGSVMPRLTTALPASRPGKKRFFWSSVAYSANVRIGPKLPAWTVSALRGQTEATCSMAITASIRLPPRPPSSSGIVMPSRPCSAIIWATSNGNRGSWARLSASAARLACAKRCTESAKSFCSSVNSKFMCRTLRQTRPANGALAAHTKRRRDLLSNFSEIMML